MEMRPTQVWVRSLILGLICLTTSREKRELSVRRKVTSMSTAAKKTAKSKNYLPRMEFSLKPYYINRLRFLL